MRTALVIIALVLAACVEHGQTPDAPDASVDAPLVCNGGGFFPRPDVESCTVTDIRIPPTVIRGTFPFPVEPVSVGVVRIRHVFQDFKHPAVGTWYIGLDGSCQFTNCLPVRPSCASLGCDDASKLEDPGCAVTGGQCRCDADGPGGNPSLECDL